MIFNTILFYYECCKSGRKKRERVGWEATVNQGGFQLFPDTCHVGQRDNFSYKMLRHSFYKNQ